jgi:hypothetical protein
MEEMCARPTEFEQTDRWPHEDGAHFVICFAAAARSRDEVKLESCVYAENLRLNSSGNECIGKQTDRGTEYAGW